jgi:hypothetical protein
VSFDGGDVCYAADSNQDGDPTDILDEVTLFATVYLNQGSPITQNHSIMGRVRGFGGGAYQYEVRFANFAPDRRQFLWGDGGGVLRFITHNADTIPHQTWFTICATGRWGASNNQEWYEDGSTTPLFSGTDPNAMVSRDTVFFNLGAQMSANPPPQFTNQMAGRLGPCLLYSKYFAATDARDLHNDIREAFPEYGLSEAS